MLSDFKFAFRQLTKSPGFTAVVVLSLALGIGANTTVICWLQNIVLRPLPGVRNQEQLAVIVSSRGSGNISLPDLRDFDAQLKSVASGSFASQITPASFKVGDHSKWVHGQIVTANFFDVLGVRPFMGRSFRADEDQTPGGNPVLVISERLWRTLFAADPAIIGRVVDLNRHSFTIIGVAPSPFRGTWASMYYDFWAPVSMAKEVRNEGNLTSRSSRGWHNVTRLRAGVSLDQAQAALSTLDAQLAIAYPRSNDGVRHHLVGLSKSPYGAQSLMGPALKLLLAVSLGVLLIVVANVANLLLARTVGRQKEIAIRLAAGASRWHLVRQLLMESLTLALMGGTLGILLASWMTGSLGLLLPKTALVENVTLDYPLDPVTLAIALALTLVTGLAFGLLPTLQASRQQLFETLKQGGRSSASAPAHHRLRSALVVGEVALALALLVAAGLCVKGLRNARHIEFGFNPEGVLIANLQIGMNGYTPETGKTFYRQIRERLSTAPGIEEAALASWFPLGVLGCKGSDAVVEGYVRPKNEDTTYEFAIVSPRYFAVMQVPLRAGRDFRDDDNETSQKVAIVNEAFAQRFWPGQDPIGRRFRARGEWRTIVAVTPTAKYNRLDEKPWPFFYLPYQQYAPDLDLNICVRTKGSPAAFTKTVQDLVHELDPGVELLSTKTMADYTSAVFFAQRIASSMLMLLGGVALVLAAMGVYAVMAYAVSQRTQEFGVRMALGAQIRDVLWQVLRHSLLLAGVGTLFGLVLAAGVTRLLSGFLFGVSPFDAATFVSIPLLLLAIALIASLIPAYRATRVDPMIALRAE